MMQTSTASKTDDHFPLTYRPKSLLPHSPPSVGNTTSSLRSAVSPTHSPSTYSSLRAKVVRWKSRTSSSATLRFSFLESRIRQCPPLKRRMSSVNEWLTTLPGNTWMKRRASRSRRSTLGYFRNQRTMIEVICARLDAYR